MAKKRPALFNPVDATLAAFAKICESEGRVPCFRNSVIELHGFFEGFSKEQPDLFENFYFDPDRSFPWSDGVDFALMFLNSYDFDGHYEVPEGISRK